MGVFLQFYNTYVCGNPDNTVDLGNSSKQWKDLYVNGLAYVDGFGEDTTMGAYKINFGTSTSMSIHYEGVTGYIKTGLVTSSDLHINCGTDSTLVLDHAVYNDANVGGLVLRTGGTAPGVVQIVDENGANTGIYTVGFAVNEEGSGSIEIPHDYKEGTDLSFHVHWGANDATTGTDNVKWQLTYTPQPDDATFDPPIIVSTETPYDTQYKWLRTDLPLLSGTNLKIGNQFQFALKRIAAVGDAFAGEALVATIGFHYQCDTIGSRKIGTK